MILLLIFVPYQIEAGSMQIVDRNKNVFKDGVEIRSTDLFLKAESGVEMENYLVLEGSVYLQSKEFHLTTNKLKFHVPSEILYAMGKVRIVREDTIIITGNSGKFSRSLMEIKGNPTFISPSMTVNSDVIKYSIKDSSFLFLSNVNFKGSEVSGKGGSLLHSIKSNKSTISESPYIFQETDSITGDKIEIDHSGGVLEVYKGTSINHTEDGRNVVSGDTLRIFYSENLMDSVIVMNNANGRFAKKEP
jgi:lipopolysaccharide assembly outer membrane protein LptD (OstA)